MAVTWVDLMVGVYHVLAAVATFIWEHHRLFELLFLAVVLGTTVWNLRAARTLGGRGAAAASALGGADDARPGQTEDAGTLTRSTACLPRVSVLVPARDEEASIGRCVASLLAQDYPDFEVLVLDDESCDRTAAIVEELAAGDGRLRLVRGAPLPVGWQGKVWACHQLSHEADGELLLFTDADTWHHPLSVRDAVVELRCEGADLVTGLPRQEPLTAAERVVVPIIAWATMAMLPIGLAQRVRWPLLSAGLGQLLLFRRAAYNAVGGHAAIRNAVVDDMALARRVKAAGGRWRFVDATWRISCRMYRDRRGVVEGLAKSIFPALGCSLPLTAVVFAGLSLAYLEPVTVMVAGVVDGPAWSGQTAWAAACVLLALASWAVVARRGHYGLFQPLLYPLTIASVLVIGILSVVLTLRGRATWKGRLLVHDDAPV